MSSDNDGDDLEKTLMMAAADAVARNIEDEDESENGNRNEAENDTEVQQRVSVIKKAERVKVKKVEPPKQSSRVAVSATLDESSSSKVGHGTRKHKSSEAVENVKRKAIEVVENVKHPRYERSEPEKSSHEGYAGVVASHYNALEEKGLDARSKSRIVYMRNFHNWIKSMLINDNLNKVKDGRKYNVPIRVLDMCCGKGGDLLKWRKGGIAHLICSDIAAISLAQCESRYEEMKSRSGRDRNSGNIYSIEYIPGDCTRIRLREKYKDPSLKLDLVSCQFAFHYSFESLPQAECMLRNASECLQPGGFFIGTMPDSNEIIARARKSETTTFGNDVFQVIFDFDVTKPALFGSKYNFHLDGVVDCPEFLVHFPTFVELAKKFGLKLIRKEKFYDFYERVKSDGRTLLAAMRSLESYPCPEGVELNGTAPDDYAHAEEFLEDQQIDPNVHIGTLSKSEWEASSLYLTFVFEKVKNTAWNSDGTPKYDI